MTAFTLKFQPSSRYAGIVVLLLSVALFFLFNTFTQQAKASLETSCGCAPGSCPMAENLPVPSYVGYTITLLLALTGVFLLLKGEQPSVPRKDWSKNLKALGLDERKLYQMVIDTEGVMFQSDLVEKSGYTKVKVSRLLDRMEAMGLLERRRRGMTNIVVLK